MCQGSAVYAKHWVLRCLHVGRFREGTRLRAKVAYYLAHDEKRAKMAQAAFAKVTRGANSTDDRLAEILDACTHL